MHDRNRKNEIGHLNRHCHVIDGMLGVCMEISILWKLVFGFGNHPQLNGITRTNETIKIKVKIGVFEVYLTEQNHSINTIYITLDYIVSASITEQYVLPHHIFTMLVAYVLYHWNTFNFLKMKYK